MPDKGHKMTDDMIAELEQKLHDLYTKANSDLQKKAASRLKKYDETIKIKEKTLDKDAFETWKKNQAYMLSNQKNLIDTITEDLVKTDQIALDIINDYTPSAYALNYNYGTYQIEDAGKINTSFALYNHDTVELLALYDDSSLLPEKKDLDIPKDLQWNKKHLSQAIAQGVLQGESIDKIAKRLSAAVGMDENGAIRNARTMMTAAQNGGRVDAYLRGKAMGIELQQKWQATEDSRTRKSHRAIDGEVIEVGEEFSNHCHFPGDPAGPGREVYNCRCTLIPLVNGIKHFENPMVAASEDSFEVIDGKDISGTWVRRPDLFDFEIEDIINAQGFDGKPRIVSADEFDDLVKQANDGKGFIAQRTYSAPDQKILETYRQQLYEGKWYVDCSTGGAQYGQGMYCAANYEGKLTDGIKAEMKHYADINYDKVFDTAYDQAVQHALDNKLDIPTKDEFKKMFTGGSYTETFTLDPSAKIIKYDDLIKIKTERLEILKKGNIDGLSIDEWKMKAIEKNKADYKNGILTGKEAIAKEEEINKKAYKATLDAIEKHDAFIKMNDGSFAASLGYDAINAAGHGESGSYTVILNRTKLIVKAPDKKYIKKGFEEWLEDQADPYIVSKFGNKSMSAIYHELKDLKNSKIGNDFYYKVLQPAGKPNEVWKKYINGTLDATNTKKIDDYLFKHFDLNVDKLDDVATKNVNNVVNGKDISATWQRRPDQFDFEIEDVINTQGFDGLPRVVDAEEFDKAVKESNFVAQRAYSAPDQDTLNAYKEQLYNGKWYVDCSTGGATYGSGMYAVPNYNGIIDKQMSNTMIQYQNRWGTRPSTVETFTLTKDAKIITTSELQKIKSEFQAKAMEELNETNWSKETMAKWDFISRNDDGVLATKLGYDAIKVDVKSSGDYQEIVILNRTKCIFKGE